MITIKRNDVWEKEDMIVENINLKIMEEKNNMTKIGIVRDYKYYQQTDCPMACIEQVQNEIAEKLDILFYPEYKGAITQLLINNELMFVNNGIILFGRFNILVSESNYYLKVLTPLDTSWIERLKTVTDNIKLIVAIISPYIDLLKRMENVNDVPYSVVDSVYNEIYSMQNFGKELEFEIPVTFDIREFADKFYNGKCILKVKRENLNSFQYSVSYEHDDESSLLKEDTLQISMLRTFLNNLYYNGEFTTRPDYVASKE